MTMKKISTLLTILLLAFLSSCTRQMDIIPEIDQNRSDRTITLTTEAPEWDAMTRATLSEVEGSLGLTATFAPGEKVRLFIVQEGTLHDLGDVSFSEISEDGSAAKLTLTLPEGVDAAQPIDIIGYNGLNQKYITVSEGKATISANAFNYSAIDKFKAPVYFRLKGITPTSDAITNMKVKFQHLGAYEIVHFTNKSDQPISGTVTLSEVSSYGPKKSWAYTDGYKYGVGGVYYLYDLISGEVSEVPDRPKHDYYTEPVIAKDQTKSVISWVLPHPDAKLPTTVLDFYNKSGIKKNIQSKSMITSKNFGMEVGKVYHVYGYWDGQQVVALDPNTNEERPTPFVTVTTDLKEGSTLKFKSYVSYSAGSTSWVDYNNNGIKDDITENAPKNFSETQISIKSQTFTFHGGFESIEMPEQSITSVKISPVAPLTQLDLRKNKLSADALNQLFDQLPDISNIEESVLQPKTLKVSGNPGVDDCNAKVAMKKGWILDITIIDDSQPYTQISLSSYESKDLYVYLDAAADDRANVWVDLNGDGEKGEGESISKFGDVALHKFTAISRDVVFYGNITKLNFISGNIFAFYGGTNHELRYLNLANCGTVAAITQGHPKLEYLSLNGNKLYTNVVPLHLATLKNLKVLDLGNCQAGELDFSNNTELMYLNVEGNDMETLDITPLTKLTQLICSANDLKALDISKAKGLFHLEVVQNALSAEQINSIIATLPDRTGMTAGGLWIANNPGTGAGNLSMAKTKNWTIDARNSKADNKVRRPKMDGEDW